MSIYYVYGGAALWGGGTRHTSRAAADHPPRVTFRDVPGEPLALLVYEAGTPAPVVSVMITPGRALDLAADLIDAARRRLTEDAHVAP